jgi:hypothetical protein
LEFGVAESQPVVAATSRFSLIATTSLPGELSNLGRTAALPGLDAHIHEANGPIARHWSFVFSTRVDYHSGGLHIGTMTIRKLLL